MKRILFDQGTPVPLRPFLPDCEVRTAAQEGWSRLQNGELIRSAEQAGFDVILTTDKNIKYQQNLAGRRIAIVLLSKQQWPQVRPFASLVLAAVTDASPGTYSEVEIP